MKRANRSMRRNSVRVRGAAVLTGELPPDRPGHPQHRLGRASCSPARTRCSRACRAASATAPGMAASSPRSFSRAVCSHSPQLGADVQRRFGFAGPGAVGDVFLDPVHLPGIGPPPGLASRSAATLRASGVMVCRREENASIRSWLIPAISRPCPSARGTHATPNSLVSAVSVTAAAMAAAAPWNRYSDRESSLRHLPVPLGVHLVEHQVVHVQLGVPVAGGVLPERPDHPVPGVLPLAQLGP